MVCEDTDYGSRELIGFVILNAVKSLQTVEDHGKYNAELELED